MDEKIVDLLEEIKWELKKVNTNLEDLQNFNFKHKESFEDISSRLYKIQNIIDK